MIIKNNSRFIFSLIRICEKRGKMCKNILFLSKKHIKLYKIHYYYTIFEIIIIFQIKQKLKILLVHLDN